METNLDNFFETTEFETEELSWMDEIEEAPLELDLDSLDEFPDWLE